MGYYPCRPILVEPVERDVNDDLCRLEDEAIFLACIPNIACPGTVLCKPGDLDTPVDVIPWGCTDFYAELPPDRVACEQALQLDPPRPCAP